MTLPRRLRWTLSILCRLLPEQDAEVLTGDLVEEYALRAQSPSPQGVERWYWKQLTGSALQLLWARLRRGRWLITLGVALGLYIAAGVIEFLGVAATSKLLSTGPTGELVSSLVLGVASLALAGYVAAALRRGAPAMLAVISIVVVATLIATMSDSAPVWYQIAFLVLAPAATLSGSALRRRTATAFPARAAPPESRAGPDGRRP